jgi:hypothetical protein
MRKLLSCLVGAFLVFVGLIVLGSFLLPAPSPASEDPAMTQIKACAQQQERIQQATTEDHKAELMWWCIQRQYRTKR